MMGIWKIDNVSSEEWERREMRRHNIRQWTITIVEIALLIGFIVGMFYLYDWAAGQILP